MGSEPSVTLAGLGRGRRWAERAMGGEIIAITGETGAPVAYLVPATEEITPQQIEWYVQRFPAWTAAMRKRCRRDLNGFASTGGRYCRATDRFTWSPT